MITKYLWELGSLIILLLGSIHLFYTFFSNKFSSKNEGLIAEMKISYPILTKETTMWRGWIGFNASHSSGAIFIGIINSLEIECSNYFYRPWAEGGSIIPPQSRDHGSCATIWIRPRFYCLPSFHWQNSCQPPCRIQRPWVGVSGLTSVCYKCKTV